MTVCLVVRGVCDGLPLQIDMSGVGCSERKVWRTKYKFGSLPVFFAKGGRILDRSLISRGTKFPKDISLVTSIQTDTNARNFRFVAIFYYSSVDKKWKHARVCVCFVYNTYTNHTCRWTLSFRIWTGLLISGFGPWRHEERDTIIKSLC